MVPVVVADGGAGLVVGAHVGQLVVEPEGLARAGGADAAREVELLAHDVVPDPVERVDVGLVAGERGHVGHARVHVGRAHRVADRLVLLDHLLVRLVVLPARALRAVRPARVEQELGEVQVALVAGHAVELDQAHLGDLVPGPDRLLAGPEGAVEQVRGPQRDVEQRPLARRLVVGHRGLVEMAEVVQLVAVHLLQLPALLPRPAVRVLRDRSCASCRGSRPAPARRRSWRSARRGRLRASGRDAR